MFDLNAVRYVKRVVVGSSNPGQMATEQDITAAQELLNRCLNETPKGSIIGIERSFTLLQVGEHQVVLQWLSYHVGFTRKPAWLQD